MNSITNAQEKEDVSPSLEFPRADFSYHGAALNAVKHGLLTSHLWSNQPTTLVADLRYDVAVR